MYQKEPQLKDATDEQLLQLLLLADRYSVPKAIAAVAAALKAAPVENLQWSTALALLTLPESCTGQECVQGIVSIAASRLQLQLGDLEMVWADEQLTQQLLALPAPVLKRLLQHQDTRVVAENTVAYTVQQWYNQQKDLTPQAAAQLGLVQLVRMRHCTQLYVSTVMAQSELFQGCFSPGELAVAVCSCSDQGCQTLHGTRCSLLFKYPAWCAARRPLSAKKQVVEWQVQLSDVKEMFEKALQDQRSRLTSQTYVMQGQPLRLLIGALHVRAHDTQGLQGAAAAQAARSLRKLWFGLSARGLQGTAARRLTLEAKMLAEVSEHLQHTDKVLRSGVIIWSRFPGKVSSIFRACSSWSDLRADMQAAGYVHDNNCLKLKVKIKELL